MVDEGFKKDFKSEIISCDVLIVGSGGAGCRAAIEIDEAGLKPLIVSKGLSFKSGCTGMAEGGYNAAFGYVDSEDSSEIHFDDTIKGGAFLNDPKLVDILVNEAQERLIDLEKYGALFDRQDNGKLNQRPFGGQSYRRTCFQGDRTGHEMITALKEEVIKRDIATIDEVMISSLVLSEENKDTNNSKSSNTSKVIGAMGFSLKDSKTIFFQAKAVILASGGAGQLYPVTSNTYQKGGDGFAVAWKAGADLIDMEQIQFHPTGMLYPKSRKGVLVTEAVRGEGGILLNKDKERFMPKYDPRGELATRDIVARAIYNEIREGRGTEEGGVYLDISHLDDEIIEEKLDTMLLQYLDIGVDIRKEAMEVAPTAHHSMGGVKIDENCKTSIDGLFAAGEVSGGVHGANRLGGNALADTQVFGRRGGISASEYVKNINEIDEVEMGELEININDIKEEESRINDIINKGTLNSGELSSNQETISPYSLKNQLQELMWNKVAIIRNEKDLESALKEIEEIQSNLGNMELKKGEHYNKSVLEALELTNMLEVAKIIVKSAIMRKESRGSHFREDYPEKKAEWDKSIVMNKNKTYFVER
ncbi:MAG: fumarate reductase (CoM/CoB) subunit TfrA [Methanobacteriaceae archaeon]